MSRKSLAIGKLSPLLGYHLRRASGAFALDFHEAMSGTGMRQVLLGILAVVDANPGVNQGAVGTALGIKRANMVSLINELVYAELVARVVAPEDRRAFSLTLTEAGQAMLADCIDRIERHEARMLSDFTADEQRTLIQLLARIEARKP
ncbi:MAG: MarR family transcriptional regulator [Sphingomonadales bacterium]|nr:MAG: MarR family transcriptional regulator [Sphingomonadales bacterium]